MPGVFRNLDPRFCGAITQVIGQQKLFINNVLAAVEGDINSHNGLGALISQSPGTIIVQGKKMIVSMMDGSAPDQLGIITHVTNLPTPAQGSQNCFAYGGAGSFGGGLGIPGLSGFPGIGEIMQLGSQAVGQVSKSVNQGGGSGLLTMNNMTPQTQSLLTAGSTVVSANTGKTFTFSSFISG
jgi:hypothetical protein